MFLTSRKLRRLPPSPSRSGATFAAALAVVAAASFSAPAYAAGGDIATRFKVNDADPISSIPTEEQRNADPMEFSGFLQDLISRAEGAFERKDYANSVKYYEALARTVPTHALPFSRLCIGYAELGKTSIAAANCAKALRLDGARVLDHFRFVTLMLEESELKPSDVADIDASLKQLREHADRQAQKAPAPPPAPPLPAPPTASAGKSLEQVRAELEQQRLESLSRGEMPKAAPGLKDLPLEIDVLACRVGVRLNDAKRLDGCAANLKARKANLRLTLPFDWARALVKKDRAGASALLGEARRLHFPDATLRLMQAEQDKTLASAGAAGFFKDYWLLLALAALGLAAGAWLWLRRASAAASPANTRPAV